MTQTLRDMGFEVVTLDSDPKTRPAICLDVLNWDFTKLKPGEFDVVFASVPCTEYSRALTTRDRNMQLADAVVQRTLEIIRHLKPKWWFIENPRGGSCKKDRS